MTQIEGELLGLGVAACLLAVYPIKHAVRLLIDLFGVLKLKLIKAKRKYTGESSLDFHHNCVFRAQLGYRGLKYGNGETVEVRMTSGKIGLYRVTSEDFGFNSTGQKNWYFEFIKYKEADK